MGRKNWGERFWELNRQQADWHDNAFPALCLVCGLPVNRAHPGLQSQGALGRWGVHPGCLALAVRERWARLKESLTWWKAYVRDEEALPPTRTEASAVPQDEPHGPGNPHRQKARRRRKRLMERRSLGK